MADFILFATLAGSLTVAALIGGRVAYLSAGVASLLVLALVLATTPMDELHGWGLLAGLAIGGVVGAFLAARNEA